jgi:hypothetical protein
MKSYVEPVLLFQLHGQLVTVDWSLFNATGQNSYKLCFINFEGNKPCTDYNEITVATFGGTTTNPVSAYADNKEPDEVLWFVPIMEKNYQKYFFVVK